MKEYVENNQGIKILTDSGYKDFSGIAYMGDKLIYRVIFDKDIWLECTEDHRVIDWKCEEKFVYELQPGNKLISMNGGYCTVKEVIDTKRIEPVYDIIDVEGHKFFSNGILSHNCEFVSADDTLINPQFLKNGFVAKQPKFNTGHIHWYEEVSPNKQYAVSLDPAMGVGFGDYSTIQVFSLPDMNQIAEWRSQTAQAHDQVRILLQILTYINNSLKSNQDHDGDPEIFWTVENNSLGEAVLTVINDTGEDNFPGWFVHEPKKAGGGRRRKGLTTTKRSKILACSKLKHLIESKRMQINSKATIGEFKNYVAHGDSYAAKVGMHDDLISAILLIVRIIQIVSQHDMDMYESLNDAINVDDMDGYEPMPITF